MITAAFVAEVGLLFEKQTGVRVRTHRLPKVQVYSAGALHRNFLSCTFVNLQGRLAGTTRFQDMVS